MKIALFISKVFNKKPVQPDNIGAASVTSLWIDTDVIYYLLNTIKLSYESKNGLVTFEKLNTSDLLELLEQIKTTTQSHLSVRKIANSSTIIKISVCGMTWQAKDRKKRVKAINEAAVLRLRGEEFSKSQAIFKHANLQEDGNTDQLLSCMMNPLLFNYENISITQFVEILEEQNARLPSTYTHRNHLNYENFRELFSQHEIEAFNRIVTPTLT